MKTNAWHLLFLAAAAAAACALLWRLPMPLREVTAEEAGLRFPLTGRDGSAFSVWPADAGPRIRRRFPGRQGMILQGTPEEYRSLAEAHPDRPWYWWHWRRSQPFSQAFTVLEKTPGNPRVPNEEYGEMLRQAAVRDPDNGLPQLLLAAAEAELWRGLYFSEEEFRFPSGEAARRAADLLREAAGKARITDYGRELLGEWRGILGRPAAFAEGYDSADTSIAAPMLLLPIDLFRCFVTEAGRLLALAENGSSPAAAEQAEQIIHNCMTAGAKTAADAALMIDVSMPLTAAEETCRKSSALFMQAGFPDAAERIRDRGRRLLRPYLVSRMVQMLRSGYTGIFDENELTNDPGMIEEARQAAALSRPDSRDSQERMRHMGLLLNVGYADYWDSNPWAPPSEDREATETISRYETWAWQKGYLAFAAGAGCLLLFLCLFLWALHEQLFADSALEWPAAGRTAGAAVTAAAAAAVPGLTASLAGNFLDADFPAYHSWHFFWTLWGFVLAGWVLAVSARGGAGAWGRLTLAGLVCSLPAAVYGYAFPAANDFALFSLFRMPPTALTAAAATLLVPAALAAAFFSAAGFASLSSGIPADGA